MPEALTESAALQRLGRLLTVVIETALRRPGDREESSTVLQYTQTLAQCLDQLRTRRRARILALRRLRHPPAVALAAQASLPGLAISPSPGYRGMPAHLASLEAFAAHYVATRLDGHDPELSESEWQDLLTEAIAEDGDADISYSENQDLREPGQLREGERLSALAHAELNAVPESLDPSFVPAELALAALEACRFTVDRLPRPTDRVDTWFTPSTVKRLQGARLPSLEAVADLIEKRGARWWVQVPGLGERRAQRLALWLREVARIGGSALPSPDQPSFGGRATGDDAALVARLHEVQLEPLQALLLPQAAGQGISAVRQDLNMLCTALAPYRGQPATLAVYSREMLRFALWCHLARGCTVATASPADAQAFEAFVQNVPASWIRLTPAGRGTPEWRPFRGQLTPASQRKALAVVHAVLRQLHDAGHLPCNAMAGALPRPARARQPFDAGRSFDTAQWHWLLQRLDALEQAPDASALASPSRVGRIAPAAKVRRLRAIVLLLQATGLRRDECVQARWSDLVSANAEGAEGPPSWWLQVGTAGTQRRIPLSETVVATLAAHAADRAGLSADDWQTPDGRARIPLISVLEPPQRLAAQRAHQPAAGPGAGDCGALSADGLYKLLKQFLRDCARAAERAGQDTHPFERASLHWLRHTFGKVQADNRTALPDLQRAMGHARRATTAHYARSVESQKSKRGDVVRYNGSTGAWGNRAGAG